MRVKIKIKYLFGIYSLVHNPIYVNKRSFNSIGVKSRFAPGEVQKGGSYIEPRTQTRR